MSDFLTNFIDDDSGDEIQTSRSGKKTGLFIVDNNDKRKNVPKVSVDMKRRDIKEQFEKKDDSLKITFKAKGYPEEEMVIPRFKALPSTLLNKSIILFGPSGSGKTTVIRDFMHVTRPCFPMVFIFAPTNKEKHDYDSLVPYPLVYEDFSDKEVKELYSRQRTTAEIYNNANNLNVLNGLFARIASTKAKMFLKKLLHYKERAIKESERKCESIADKKKKREEINDIFKEKLIRFYKQVINPNAKKLSSMDLKQEEKFALKYRNLNPRVLVLFDDATVEVMKMIRDGRKKNDETIKNFFFKGRWAYITHWYAFHDDNRVESDICKNAFRCVFTNKQVANAYFSRTKNSFTPIEKKKAEAVINVIFSEENESKHYKLIYSRADPRPWTYFVAEEHEDKDVQMCSKTVREYCKRILSKGNNFDVHNPFYQKFASNI